MFLDFQCVLNFPITARAISPAFWGSMFLYSSIFSCKLFLMVFSSSFFDRFPFTNPSISTVNPSLRYVFWASSYLIILIYKFLLFYQFYKIFQNLKPSRPAFFRVELGGEYLVFTDYSGDFHTVINGGSDYKLSEGDT